MKVLVGTPVNENKDYAAERWLHNVATLTKNHPADLLIVDNSETWSYRDKLESLCQKFGIENYKILHLETTAGRPRGEKIGLSREAIREHFLAGSYDAWFSWESDQIIPDNTLQTLSSIMQSGNYSMVHANSWDRAHPGQPAADFGCCLISRETLEKHSFNLVPPEDCWHGGEARFKKKVLSSGGTYLELYGTIEPIYHLTQP